MCYVTYTTVSRAANRNCHSDITLEKKGCMQNPTLNNLTVFENIITLKNMCLVIPLPRVLAADILLFGGIFV